jgi:transcriptional regulator with XRE-family HTH domain
MVARYARNIVHLTPAELAERLGMSEGQLANWRSEGRGPSYIRSEATGTRALVRYPLAEVEAWEKRQLVVPAAAP